MCLRQKQTNSPHPRAHTHTKGVGYWGRSHAGGDLWHPEGWSSFGLLWGLGKCLGSQRPESDSDIRADGMATDRQQDSGCLSLIWPLGARDSGERKGGR